MNGHHTDRSGVALAGLSISIGQKAIVSQRIRPPVFQFFGFLSRDEKAGAGQGSLMSDFEMA